jgi:hypothetical protein
VGEGVSVGVGVRVGVGEGIGVCVAKKLEAADARSAEPLHARLRIAGMARPSKPVWASARELIMSDPVDFGMPVTLAD